MSKSDKVEVNIYLQDKNWITVIGRCLGYVPPDEFASLMMDRNLQKGAFSSEGNTINNLEKVLSIEGFRLVLTVTDIKSNDTPAKDIPIQGVMTAMGKKVLYVTEPLDYVACFPSEKSGGELSIVTKSGAYLTIDLSE